MRIIRRRWKDHYVIFDVLRSAVHSPKKNLTALRVRHRHCIEGGGVQLLRDFHVKLPISLGYPQ